MGVPKDPEKYKLYIGRLRESHLGQKAWNKGIPCREETKRKLSENHKGKQCGKDNPFYGKKHTKETRAFLSKNAKYHGKHNPNHGMKGKKHSRESRELMKRTNRGKTPWVYKKGHTEESKKKISEIVKREYREGKRKLTCSVWKKGNVPHNKGKTMVELYGEERAKEIKSRVYSEESRNKLRQYTGERASQWKGGKSFEPYTTNFSKKVKRKVKKRDMRCMLCYVSLEDLKQLKRQVHVHHIDYDKTNSLPQNLITLCHNCHMITNNNRDLWVKAFHTLLNEQYNYEYSNEQKIILDFMDLEE